MNIDSLFTLRIPEELIAQSPSVPRDSSRLLVIDKHNGHLSHHIFRDLPDLLQSTDILVFNNSAVIPARLHGRKSTGGNVEILLLKNINKHQWEVISHPGIKPGQILNFPQRIAARVISSRLVSFQPSLTPRRLSAIGSVPLPPYIHSTASEKSLRRQYQTVFAKNAGSAAAPTAGLHFTPRLLNRLSRQGIQTEFITLHVGLGTFKPPTPEQIATGRLHSEQFTLDPRVAKRLNAAKSAGRRIIAVGTTTTRVLESCTTDSGKLLPKTGETDIFIQPPYRFKFVDGLITNFHLPESSLILLVSSFSSPEITTRTYEKAIAENYRFYSFGDACFFI